MPSDVFSASITWNVNVSSNRAGTSPVLDDKRHQFTQLLRKFDCCPFSKFLLKGMNGLMALFVRPFLFFHAAGAFCFGDAMLCTGEGRPRVPYRTSTRRICQHGRAGGCLLWAVQVPRMCCARHNREGLARPALVHTAVWVQKRHFGCFGSSPKAFFFLTRQPTPAI